MHNVSCEQNCIASGCRFMSRTPDGVPRPCFPKRRKNFGDSAINKGYIAHFSLHMRETALISTSGLKSDVTIVFLDPDFLKDAKFRRFASGGASIFRLPGTARAPKFRLRHLRKIVSSFLISNRSGASSYTVSTNGSTHGRKQ